MKDKKKVSDISFLMEIWDPEKNTHIHPEDVTPQSSKAVSWHCKKCNYRWEEKIKRRFEGNGKCPCCETHQVIVKGISDIFTLVPELKNYYDFEKNKDVDILTLKVSSKVPLWWKCPECDHSWQSNIPRRIKKNGDYYKVIGCRKCCHKSKITPVSSDPAMIEIWDFEKNTHKDISATSVHSTDPVHWRFKICGHEWYDSPKARHAQKGRCPICNNKKKPIVPGTNDVLTLCPEITEYINTTKNKELDFVHHGVNAGVMVDFKCPDCGKEWSAPLKSRMAKTADGTYRVKKHSCNHSGLRKKSYVEEVPYLETLYDKNSNEKKLTEIKTVADSMKEYNWQCDKCGEHYPSTVNSMIVSIKNNNNGCPFCSHTKLRPGESFADIHPELMKEYDDENTIDPLKAFPNSKSIVLWKCGNNPSHKWPASFAARHAGGSNCPICCPKIAIPGVNTLAAIHSDIAEMWSPKNIKTSDEIIYNSHQWIYLNCSDCGQEFGTFLNEFVEGKSTCPYCDKRKPTPGVNSLASFHPEILDIWSPNNRRNPENVFPHSTDQAKFICAVCHSEYTAVIKDVVDKTSDCPYCNERLPLPGFNTFAAKHPNLMDEWDYVNNYCIADPDNILDNNTIPVWWICKNNNGHRYKMSVRNRLRFEERNREPCIYCKGRRRKKKRFV